MPNRNSFYLSRIRGAARRTGQRSLNVLRRAGGAMGRLASATDRNMRALARTANRGFNTMKLGSNKLLFACHQRRCPLST